MSDSSRPEEIESVDGKRTPWWKLLVLFAVGGLVMLGVYFLVPVICEPFREAGLPRHSLRQVMCAYPEGRALDSGLARVLLIFVGLTALTVHFHLKWRRTVV